MILGPSLVVDNYGTLWIEQTWKAKVGTKGTILIEKKPDDSFQKVNFSLQVAFSVWLRKWEFSWSVRLFL